jgi:MFS family permease
MSTPTIDAHGIRNIDFNKLWVGQSISLIGSQVTLLAIPITAAVTLGATAMQMGLLSALGALPALVFGLPAGAWVDRHKRRPILIGTDIGRALILAIVPLSAVLGMLKIEVLYGAAFLVGALGLFFNVAYRSYLPGLVGREQLVKANSRLELSNSIAEIIGPGAAGGLIQLVGPPIAIAVDAFSFIISAFSIGWIRKPEIVVNPIESDTNLWKEIKAGLRLVFGEPRLRALAGCLSSLNLFNSILEAVSILFLTRQVGLSAGWIGVIFASGSIGFLLGAVIAERVTRGIGLGKALVLSVLVIGGSDLLIPLSGKLHGLWLAVGVLVVAQFLFGLGLTIFQIGQVSLRQSLTPDNLQGRMNATLSTLSWGIVPLGGLLGGGLGQVLGLSLTLVLASFGEILAVLWLVFSPVRMIRQTGTA